MYSYSDSDIDPYIVETLILPRRLGQEPCQEAGPGGRKKLSVLGTGRKKLSVLGTSGDHLGPLGTIWDLWGPSGDHLGNGFDEIIGFITTPALPECADRSV